MGLINKNPKDQYQERLIWGSSLSIRSRFTNLCCPPVTDWYCFKIIVIPLLLFFPIFCRWCVSRFEDINARKRHVGSYFESINHELSGRQINLIANGNWTSNEGHFKYSSDIKFHWYSVFCILCIQFIG